VAADVTVAAHLPMPSEPALAPQVARIPGEVLLPQSANREEAPKMSV
jgi:hypothetical protein